MACSTRGSSRTAAAEDAAQPLGLGVDAAGPPGLFEQGAELGQGERGGVGGGGGGGEDDAGLGAQDAAAGASEGGGEEPGAAPAQVGAELVVRGGAVPDRVLLGAGEHVGRASRRDTR